MTNPSPDKSLVVIQAITWSTDNMAHSVADDDDPTYREIVSRPDYEVVLMDFNEFVCP